MLRLVGIVAMASFVTACGESHPKLVSRQPKAEMLQAEPCVSPAMPPAAPTRQQIDAGWVSSTQSALCFETKFNTLADFVKAGP